MKIEDKRILDIYNDIVKEREIENEIIDDVLNVIKNDYCQALVFEWWGNNECLVYFVDIDCPNITYSVASFDNVDMNDEVFQYDMKKLSIKYFVENYENF